MNGLVQAIINIGETLPALTALSVIIAFIGGLLFIAKGIVMMAKITNSGHQASTGAVLTNFAVGVGLISLGSVALAGTGTLFATGKVSNAGEIFSYAPTTIGLIDDSTTKLVITTIVKIVQFIGLLGIIRGLFLFSAVQNQQAKGISAPIVFVVSGIIAMNFPVAVGALSALFT